MQTAKTVSLCVVNLLAFGLLSGCAGPTSREWVNVYIEQGLRDYTLPAVVYAEGIPDNCRPAQARLDMQADAAQAQEWLHGDRSARVTTAGPVLRAYGAEGMSGITDVARCTIDVSLVASAGALHDKYIRRCFDLLPAANRELIYQSGLRQYRTVK